MSTWDLLPPGRIARAVVTFRCFGFGLAYDTECLLLLLLPHRPRLIGGCVNELPASYHIRTLHMAYLSGAALVEIEGCGWLDTLPGGGRSPYPISSAVDGFGQFVHGTLQPAQRGRPDSLVALLLPHDHGFDERPSWADAATSWNYAKLPARRGGR